jgi:hypothetical protein
VIQVRSRSHSQGERCTDQRLIMVTNRQSGDSSCP